jgi:hypothetical protein
MPSQNSGVSKQAVNPGPNFGPYGLPKATAATSPRRYGESPYGGRIIRRLAPSAPLEDRQLSVVSLAWAASRTGALTAP